MTQASRNSTRKPRKQSHGDWIPVSVRKPRCRMEFGTPVLIWPRNGGVDYEGYGIDGFAYYGRRATPSSRPEFYLFGIVLLGVTHWQPMPEGPRS